MIALILCVPSRIALIALITRAMDAHEGLQYFYALIFNNRSTSITTTDFVHVNLLDVTRARDPITFWNRH